jgi:hypothetical protein
LKNHNIGPIWSPCHNRGDLPSAEKSSFVWKRKAKVKVQQQKKTRPNRFRAHLAITDFQEICALNLFKNKHTIFILNICM